MRALVFRQHTIASSALVQHGAVREPAQGRSVQAAGTQRRIGVHKDSSAGAAKFEVLATFEALQHRVWRDLEWNRLEFACVFLNLFLGDGGTEARTAAGERHIEVLQPVPQAPLAEIDCARPSRLPGSRLGLLTLL